MQSMHHKAMLMFDREHIWHPYASMQPPPPIYQVAGAAGVRLRLQDGRELIDGMSSWWSAIHGYNVPELNAAAGEQLDAMSHVMFGGLSHRPAVELAAQLVDLAPTGLDTMFFCDSGSVAVEVALKMALQYWHACGQNRRQRFLTIRGGYHGDTFHAMSVCDPITGMHRVFQGVLPQQLFADRPRCAFHASWQEHDIDSFKQLIEKHCDTLAAVILEPVVQGAGGMYFYHSRYLKEVRQLCDRHDVLLICDEIATGFGRSGRMFACEHAAIIPDIMCLGKALTGGYLTLAVTLTNRRVRDGISGGDPGVFMHGPTFMANPLACRIAAASIELLLKSPWQARVAAIERQMAAELAPAAVLPQVADVRVLGAIGVIELTRPVNLPVIQQRFVERGVWIRPFGRLLYIMPPYIITPADVCQLTSAMVESISEEVLLPDG
jgi:adenosylmethionine---8-amino-7-oxononanoate aminotransferase